MRLSEIGVFLRTSYAVGLVVCVSACGGGGGGGSPNPVLGTLSFTTNENVAITTGVTATDPGGGQVTFSQAGNPTSGTVSGFTPAGAFTYTPNSNFTGSDSFAIQATDTAGNKTMGTVTITVKVYIVLGTLSFTTNQSVAFTGSLTATDPGGGPVTFSQTGNPTSGTVSGFTATGGFTYTPNAKFTGSDSFGIQAADAAGNKTMGTVAMTVTVNKPPTASNTILRADGADLAKINVLQNANDPDKDPLTVTILDQPPTGAGTASVNSDGTVSLAGLSGFKGLTHFTYHVTDPSGATAKAAAAVFVGTDPFRAAFVGDAANGSNEVYLTDFAADPVAITSATQGNLRLKGFAISDNGATVVYRTEDTASPATTSLSFVKTAAPTQATSIPLPSGTVPVLDGIGKDQFIVSTDGQWIAVIAGQGNSDSLYVVNIANPTVVSQIEPAGAAYATLPTFSPDSKSIYFLATSVPGGGHKSLYYASLSSTGQTTLISKASDPATSDEVYSYSVSPDQTRILLEANRGGRLGVFYVDASHPQTENQVNRPLGFGQSIQNTTVGLAPGRGGSTTVKEVAYVVNAGVDPVNYPAGIYVAEVSTTPNPRLEIQNTNLQVIGFRPERPPPEPLAILYTDGAQVTEAFIDVAGTHAVGGGSNGWYDSTGNIVLLQQAVPYTILASTARTSATIFGMTQRVGTTSLALDYSDVSGFDRGVAIIGQGPTSGSAPASATLQIVSALAPQGLLPLASFQSPLQLTSYSSKVVSK